MGRSGIGPRNYVLYFYLTGKESKRQGEIE
jgi:hypothetical protein